MFKIGHQSGDKKVEKWYFEAPNQNNLTVSNL